MQFFLHFNQEKTYGQIPITNEQGKITYIIRGNLDNPNHTLYLSDTNNDEIGRLFSDRAGLIASYTVDVINHSLVQVKKLNSPLTNLFYITRLNYLVTGSIKNGTYKFRELLKQVASVETLMTSNGVTLVCEISRPEDIPFILLISVLFTQWNIPPLRLPTFPPITRVSTDPN